MIHRTRWLCPVRPSENSNGRSAPETDDEWEEIVKSGLLDDSEHGSKDAHLLEGELVDAEDGVATQVAKGMPAPRQPTREEIARHNLTHLPYRAWCPHCLAARRPNSHHTASPSSRAGRTVPVFVADYCFSRKPEETLLTGLVGKLYPSNAYFASICDSKGPDDSVVDRLSDFFRNTGITKLVYKQDQEPAIRAAIERALVKIGRTGEPIGDEQLVK